MDTIEYWLPVPNIEPKIEASNLGRLRRLERNLCVAERDHLGRSKGNFRKVQPASIISEWLNNNGYKCVTLSINGVKKKYLSHRLIAFTFLTGHFDSATVDHLDGNKQNNAASNLEWVTLSENTRRQNRDGRGVPKGEKHPLSKLKDKDLVWIPALREQGLSYEKIGAILGVSGSLIHKIHTGARRKKI